MKNNLLSEITYEGLSMSFLIDGIGFYTIQQLIYKFDGLNREDIWNLQALSIGDKMDIHVNGGILNLSRTHNKTLTPDYRPFAMLDNSRASWRSLVGELENKATDMKSATHEGSLVSVANSALYLRDRLLPELIKGLEDELEQMRQD